PGGRDRRVLRSSGSGGRAGRRVVRERLAGAGRAGGRGRRLAGGRAGDHGGRRERALGRGRAAGGRRGAPLSGPGAAPPLRITLLGAGVMGRNIARVFLRAGAQVTLYSRSDATLDAARAALAGEALERLTTTREIVGADLVLESVPERIELKRELLAQAEAAMPDDAILATNTSSL